MTDLTIRWMLHSDRTHVLRIENMCFPNPWPDSEFSRTLRSHDAIGYTAMIGDRVVGYCIYGIRADCLDVLNFAVMPAVQRRGVGRAMFAKLASKLIDKRKRLVCMVRETNLDALLFWRSMGFKAVSILREYYDGTDEDAILMHFKQPKNAPAVAVVEVGGE